MEKGAAIQKRRPQTKSCLRCHRRKQKCEGYPTCLNCQAANAVCTRDAPPVLRRLAGLSKEELLDKIDALETTLSRCAHGEDQHTPVSERRSPASLAQPVQALNNDEPRHSAEATSRAVFGPGSDHHDSAVTTSQTVFGPGSPNGTSTGEKASSAVTPSRDALHWPDEETGVDILKCYLDSMHRRLPFCNYSDILDLHRRRHEIWLRDDSISRFQRFKLYMVYATGTVVLKLTRHYASTPPERYFAAALEIKESSRKFSPIQRIEALLFITLYNLRASLTSEVWYLIGLAMRTAIEVGLHREHYYRSLDLETAELRKRLFWGVYLIERGICFSLKRPLSIAEHDIDVGHPSLGMNNDTGASDTIANSSKQSSDPDDLSAFVSIIRLNRIRSQIYREMNGTDRDRSLMRTKIRPMLDEIFRFEESLAGHLSADSMDFLSLHINNNIRSLIEPVLPDLDPSDDLLKICLHAAGRLCQSFKRLRLNKSLSYSFLMVNAVFTSGMTIS